MKDKEYERWKNLRVKGAGRYIILYGALLWGGAMFALMILSKMKSSAEFFTYQTLSGFLVWTSAGVLFGVINWFVMEFLYKKSQRRRMTENRSS
ncbi:hypothetical protein [Pseudomonas chlororaphis]|uniref:hypothetical protein n=1 Tax=Pseudomonas chlororaphis TaxID=587753 RepID=UPI0012D34A99|nr:hypothetical protein [Pseudomonas chlororaphis]